MRFPKALAALTVTTAVAASVAACGTPDPKAVDAVAAYVTTNMSGGVPADQAKCIGKAWVGDLGKANLVQYGYITGDLKPAAAGSAKNNMSKDDANKAADGFTRCLNAKAILSNELQKVAPGKADCINSDLTSDVVHKWVALQLQGDEKGMLSTLQNAIGKCLPNPSASASAKK